MEPLLSLAINQITKHPKLSDYVEQFTQVVPILISLHSLLSLDVGLNFNFESLKRRRRSQKPLQYSCTLSTNLLRAALLALDVRESLRVLLELPSMKVLWDVYMSTGVCSLSQ